MVHHISTLSLLISWPGARETLLTWGRKCHDSGAACCMVGATSVVDSESLHSLHPLVSCWELPDYVPNQKKMMDFFLGEREVGV